jgi:hypothetical protein
MILADLVPVGPIDGAIGPVIDMMMLIFAGFIIVVIAAVAYFLLKRAKRKKMVAKRARAKNASR